MISQLKIGGLLTQLKFKNIFNNYNNFVKVSNINCSAFRN